VRDTELQAAREERDLAIRDKMDAMRIRCARCGGGDDGERAGASDEKSSLVPELLRKAWEQRDGAVRRKNTVQVQLARTRVDILQANGQLMEAIGQKVELSQQLEQWQVGNGSARAFRAPCLLLTGNADVFKFHKLGAYPVGRSTISTRARHFRVKNGPDHV